MTVLQTISVLMMPMAAPITATIALYVIQLVGTGSILKEANKTRRQKSPVLMISSASTIAVRRSASSEIENACS
jgi:hypothetical protein